MIATGAALLARSVATMYAVEPGVSVEGVAIVDVCLTARSSREPRADVERTDDGLYVSFPA